jgi:nucleosome assembly protein 1-like 1
MPKGSTFGGPPPVVEEDDDMEEKLSLEELQSALANPYHTLPPVVRRRVDALSNLHKQYLVVQKQYQNEVQALERKFAKLYEPILDKRAQVISGAHEPTEDEARVEKKPDEEEAGPLREAQPDDANIKGIPDFWLNAMQNNHMVAEAIYDTDEEALSYLTDVRYSELEEGKHGFTLVFHFAENPFFSNTTLTKTYSMEEEELFGELLFDHATGTKIDWKAGKNLTVKQIKKKVKAKGKGKGTRTVTVDEPQDSFFSFFSPPEITDDTENPEEAAAILENDFDIGCIFKDKLIPYSLLWFTGEAAEFEDEFDEFDDDEDELDEGDEEDEDDDEEDEDEPPRKGRGGAPRGGPGHSFAPPPAGAKGGNAPAQPPQPECKQQ